MIKHLDKFNSFFKDILKLKLNSLKIFSKRDYSENEIDLNSLSSVMSLSTLTRFELNIPTFQLTYFQWPLNSHIKSLEINCPRLNQYYSIVRHFPNLEKFVLFGLKEVQSEERFDMDDQLKVFNNQRWIN